MLYGVTISAFRNFDDVEQWICPLSRINIIIGSNNSGKSNVLRYLDRVVAPALQPDRTRAIERASVDLSSEGNSASSFELWVPFEPTKLTASWQPAWKTVFQTLDLLDKSESFVRLRISTGAIERGQRFVGAIPKADHITQQTFYQIWASVTGSNGGSFENHWFPGVMNKIIHANLQHLRTHFIPSFRQITSRMDEFKNEYAEDKGGDHIIDRLAALAYPAYTEQEKKHDFEKLRKFVGAIIDDDDVSIEIPNDRKTVNVKTGHRFLPIEALGSGVHEVFMLASEIVTRPGSTILLEEPEVHLHPTLQRRFMNFLSCETKNQIFITTHSATIIDTAEASVFEIRKTDSHARLRVLSSSQSKFEACREIGFKASDLLQTNSVVWVEGPSDRIYLLAWLKSGAPDLEEGLHFSVMFYGGKLLSRLSIDDEAVADFIKLLPLCRRPAILIDSDKSGGNSAIRSTKLRIQAEFAEIDAPCWITEGREIENFYSRADRLEAVKAVHSNVLDLVGGPTRYDSPITFKRAGGDSKNVVADKIAIANYLVEKKLPSVEHEVFARQLSELISYIREANK